jgi:hypothetical protein
MMIANEKSGTWLAFIAMAVLILLQLQVLTVVAVVSQTIDGI